MRQSLREDDENGFGSEQGELFSEDCSPTAFVGGNELAPMTSGDTIIFGGVKATQRMSGA